MSKKEYVCLPCGSECDAEIHDGPGTCQHCGMGLVDNATFKFSNIPPSEFCSKLLANKKIILLDVRTPQEFNGTDPNIPAFGRFKNAININVEELQSRIGELSKYKDQEVLVYCSHNHRSPRASYILSTSGFRHVTNMTDGVSTLVGQEANTCLKKAFEFYK
ncbi:MAG: rhodanese-like domain-containing protein [Chryseolinea sp.]